MKKISLLTLAFLLSIPSFSQKSNGSSSQDYSKFNWLTFDDAYKSQPEVLVNNEKELLGLAEEDALLVGTSKHDFLGIEHISYSQTHQNIKVEGAAFKLHIAPERPLKGNGRLVFDINANPNPSINSAQAFEIALDFMNAESFYWENPEMEQLIKQIENNSEATYLPTAELVYASKNYSQNGADYKLAWKFDISSFGDKNRKIVFVNANDGSILYTLDGHHSEGVESEGITRYSGTQSFITDSVSPGFYRLRDNTRGGGIQTWNLQESTNYSNRVDFTNDGAFWDIANEDMDDAALDAHWAIQETYDYYIERHDRDSYDNQGSLIISYIHFDQNWFNAQWTGSFMQFGDGSNNPLTSIDVVAHEFTHGVTQYTASLIYQNESGALNESFSDVFGTAVEFFALGDDADWIIGADNFSLRSMENPNSLGDPDTYKGTNWVTGTNDNGGVHTNSGVQNYWYYLLSVGGSGVNSNGDPYFVEGIGIEAASAIAYRNLSVYLTPSSNYASARLGALNSAEDLYGECSNEALQTLRAWQAVGVGTSDFYEDIYISEYTGPFSDCGLTNEEFLSIEIINNDQWCVEDHSAGTMIKFGYRIDDGEDVLDSLLLSSTLSAGESLEFTFSQPLDLSVQGNHVIQTWVKGPHVSEEEPVPFKEEIVGSKVTLSDGNTIGFEDTEMAIDSFTVIAGIHADSRLSISAESTGSRGFRMTGKGVEADNLEFDIPTNEDDNFVTNPEYGAKLCFCVDAVEWTNATLTFDLQQTHSEFYLQEFGDDFTNFVSSMRILVNDVQLGGQYHPITYEDDPYLTYSINLDDYAGTNFDVCFESKTFLSKVDDPIGGSDGDNVYLDNIMFTDEIAVGITEETEQFDFNVSPNPNHGTFKVELNNDFSGKYQLTVVDVLGRVVFSYPNLVVPGDHINIDISQKPKGIYSVLLSSESEVVVKKIIIE